jgi:hypothetical protein
VPMYWAIRTINPSFTKISVARIKGG